MPSQEWHSFHPGLEKHRISAIYNKVSVQAFYAFDLIYTHRDAAPFTFGQINTMSMEARRFHTGELLKKCLLQLVDARALVDEVKSETRERGHA
jgi:hypothetical protein